VCDKPANASPVALDRATILKALAALSDALKAQGVVGERCLFGGTAMVLAYSARVSTKDVDALFQPTQPIRDLSRQIAAQLDIPESWLNDGVKGFVSDRHELIAGNLPQFPNLRLTMPTPEYLLAMKCMAARLGGLQGEPSDVPDILFLIKHLGLRSAKDTLDLVACYYPADRVPVKTQYLIEGLFEEGKV